jgi:diguanylate cyclase (GGDEF)-like protein
MKDSVFNRVDKNLWKELQDKFAEEVKLPVITIDIEGNNIVSSNKFPFICQMFRNKKLSLCKKQWILHLNKLKNKEGIYFFPCLGGLSNIIAPLKLFGELIGAMIICGIKRDNNIKDYSQIAIQLGVEKNELVDALNDISQVKDEEIKRNAELLAVFSKLLPVIAKKSYDASRKNCESDIILKLLTISNTKKRVRDVARAVINSLIEMTNASDCSVLIDSGEGVKKISHKNHVQIGADNEKKLLAKFSQTCALISLNKEFGLDIHSDYNDMLIIPLKIRDKKIGSVFLYGGSTKNIKEQDLTFYSVLSQEISLLILNAMQYEELETLAVKDKLTEVYNRRYFMEALNKEMSQEGPLSLILIDVDDFGNYNNNYGHQQGDILLREIGRLLKENTRVIDVVGRYGGEEFIILLPNAKSTEAAPVAERIRAVIEQARFNEKVTVSIGLVICMDRRIRAEELIREADKSLYEAKSKGKNTIVKKIIIDKNMSRYDL